MKKRTWAIIGVLIVIGCVGWGLNLYFNSPGYVISQVTDVSTRSSEWAKLFSRLDPDDVQANGWTPSKFESFMLALTGSDLTGDIVAKELLPLAPAPSPGAPSSVTWNRTNTRFYNLSVVKGAASVPLVTLRLRRHFDGKWYFQGADLIVAMSKSDGLSTRERYRRYLRAFQVAEMTELFMVRPRVSLRKADIEDWLAGRRSEAVFFDAHAE